MYQARRRTYHVYVEDEREEAALPPVEAAPQPDAPTRFVGGGAVLGVLLSLLCLAVPALGIGLAPLGATTSDASLTRTLTLTLARHPAAGQLSLYALPVVSIRQQLTVAATGSVHQEATHATGLITFYNGLFSPQTVPAGTMLTGRDGITVVTSQDAVIPPATPTTPPTYGTVSVLATSRVAGSVGNLAAHDIDQACCGPSILAQNLDAFSGGQDARDMPVLTQSDLNTGRLALTAQVDEAAHRQAQQEARPGYLLLPLDCKMTFIASHAAGEQAASSTLTLTETCPPLAYFVPEVEAQAMRLVRIPPGSRLVSFVAFVAESHVTATGGTLTVEATVYLMQNRMPARPYPFTGK